MTQPRSPATSPARLPPDRARTTRSRPRRTGRRLAVAPRPRQRRRPGPTLGFTDGAAASGSLAWTMPAGSSTTSTAPSGDASTCPVASSASSGSISGRRSRAAPRRIRRPVAVPSSSVKPSGRRSTTSPPTLTVAPTSPSRSTRSAAGAVGRGCRRDGARAGRGRPLCRAARARSGGGHGSPVDADVGREPGRDREAAVGSAREGPPGDPDDRRGSSLLERGARDAGPGLADHDDLLRADDDLGPPPVAQLADRVDAAGDAHQAPLVGEPGLPVEDQGGGRRSSARDREGVRPEPRGVIGDADPAGRVDPGPDRRRGAVGRQQDLDGARAVLDDDPPPGRVEQRGGCRHDRVDGHIPIGDPERAGDRHGGRRPGSPGSVMPCRHGAWGMATGPGRPSRPGRQCHGPRPGSRRERPTATPAARRSP